MTMTLYDYLILIRVLTRVATQKFKKIQEHFQNISKFFKNNYSMNIAKKQNH